MFQPGQEIMCIKTVESKDWASFQEMKDAIDGFRLPVKGEKFTVRWCGERPFDFGLVAVALCEIVMPEIRGYEVMFDANYFRAIAKTDISVLQKLCNPIRTKELELV